MFRLFSSPGCIYNVPHLQYPTPHRDSRAGVLCSLDVIHFSILIFPVRLVKILNKVLVISWYLGCGFLNIWCVVCHILLAPALHFSGFDSFSLVQTTAQKSACNSSMRLKLIQVMQLTCCLRRSSHI